MPFKNPLKWLRFLRRKQDVSEQASKEASLAKVLDQASPNPPWDVGQKGEQNVSEQAVEEVFFTANCNEELPQADPDQSLLSREEENSEDSSPSQISPEQFKTPPAAQQLAADKTIDSDRIGDSLQLEKQQTSIDTLKRLVVRYLPTSASTKAELENYCRTLKELGIAYRELGEMAKAEYHLRQAVEVADDIESLRREKASLLHELGWICGHTRRIQEAESLYKASLEIKEPFGDTQNKAATLHQLGILKANQGEIEAAIARFQQSLDINQQNDNTQTKAATLHCLGMLKANQGEIEAAITLYHQSLAINEQIGNVQIKAATLHQLGILKANQGEIEAAITLYQQSLDIKEQIGNVRGKAATLHQLGILKANQGEIEAAITLYQQSLDIKEQIDDIKGKAATLHCLGILKVNQGEIEAAIALFQQSLAINQQIGNVQTKAMTLQWLGVLAADVEKDYNTGIRYFQESLEILQRLSSPKAENAQRQLARIQALAAEQAQSAEA